MSNSKLRLRNVVHTAVIIAIVMVLRNFSYMVSFGGAGGMRIGVSGFFSHLPALMFGPLYGGITGGIVDVLGFLIKPEGGYIPLLTLSAILGGIITGFLWRTIKNINVDVFRKIFLILFLILALIGVINQLFISCFDGSEYNEYILSFGKRTEYLTVWLIIAGLAALAIFGLDAFLRKKSAGRYNVEFIKILTVLLISNVTVTTINTVILMSFTPALAKLGFIVFYVPRLVQEVIASVIQSYIISYIMKLYGHILKN